MPMVAQPLLFGRLPPRGRKLLFALFVFAICFLFAFPVLWLILTSLRPESGVYYVHRGTEFTIGNFAEVLKDERVVGAFAKDDRILGWDVWNEPDNSGGGDYGKTELKPSEKKARVAVLLPQVFAWAREVHPSQPLTSGLWDVDISKDDSALHEVDRIQMRESDIITFHNYSWPESFKAEVDWLKKFHRPIVCTEFMARSVGSTFDTILPIAKEEKVGAINWGFVAGKTQTYYPWESWDHPYVKRQPPVWFHEVLHPDGTPYRQAEADQIRRLTGKQ